MEMAIRAEGLTREFGAVRALDALTLEVPAGAVFGFLGPNGAGKTTTLRLLLGLLEPTAGRAEVLGFDTRRAAGEIRARTGALLEHAGLYERLSAEENLEFYARIWRMGAPERKARIRELLEPLGLYERRHERVGGWSRGMKQKLAVARALLHRPALVFLDEPTAGLDPVATVSFRDDIARLARSEGTTVFLTTHNLAEAEKVCSLVGVIRQGRLLDVGAPEALRARAAEPRVEITGRGLDERVARLLAERPEVTDAEVDGAGGIVLRTRETLPVGTLAALVAQAGGEVEDVRRTQASLEDAYLRLMEEEGAGAR
jgi:ABC-2 type transport system ATP-binding protein